MLTNNHYYLYLFCICTGITIAKLPQLYRTHRTLYECLTNQYTSVYQDIKAFMFI